MYKMVEWWWWCFVGQWSTLLRTAQWTRICLRIPFGLIGWYYGRLCQQESSLEALSYHGNLVCMCFSLISYGLPIWSIIHSFIRLFLLWCLICWFVCYYYFKSLMRSEILLSLFGFLIILSWKALFLMAKPRWKAQQYQQVFESQMIIIYMIVLKVLAAPFKADHNFIF